MCRRKNSLFIESLCRMRWTESAVQWVNPKIRISRLSAGWCQLEGSQRIICRILWNIRFERGKIKLVQLFSLLQMENIWQNREKYGTTDHSEPMVSEEAILDEWIVGQCSGRNRAEVWKGLADYWSDSFLLIQSSGTFLRSFHSSDPFDSSPSLSPQSFSRRQVEAGHLYGIRDVLGGTSL